MKKNPGLREKANQILKQTRKRKTFRFVFLSVVVILIVVYNILLTPAVFEKIVKSQFNKRSNGKIKLHIVQSSLLRGFRIENLEILSGPDFDNRVFLKIDKLNILYSVYGFFAGDFGFHELGVYNPQVYLYFKDNSWNYSTLMKSSPRKPEKEKPKKESPKNKDGFSLPVKVRGFIKFILQNFKVHVTYLNDNANDSFEAGIKDFTLKTYVITKNFSYIPYNVDAAEIFKSIVVNLDPQKTIDVYFKNENARLKSPLDLHWLLTFDENMQKEGFYSRLLIGHQDIPVEYKGRHLLPLKFGLDYDLKYNPRKDEINLNYFRLSFMNDVWMNLTGLLQNPSKSGKMKVYLEGTKSEINIAKILPYYRALTGDDSLNFRGMISLIPLNISGETNNLSLAGKISLNHIYAEKGDMTIDVSYFDFLYKSILDPGLNDSFIKKVRKAEVSWSGVFNRAALGANLNFTYYRSDRQDINAHVYAKNFNPEPFTPNLLNGLFNLDFKVSGESQKDMSSVIEINSPSFVYYLGRGISGSNQLKAYVKSNLHFKGEGYSSLAAKLEDISVTLFNEKSKKAFDLSAALDAVKNPGKMSATLNLSRMAVNLKNLKPTLPESYSEKIDSYAQNSKKDIRISGVSSFQKSDNNLTLDNVTNFFIDDLGIDDLVFKTNISKDANRITIKNMTLNGLNKALASTVEGSLSRKYDNGESHWMPDIKYAFKLGSDERTRIFKSNTLSGTIDLNGFAKDYIVQGKFNIAKLYFDNGNFTRINNVNLDFPFYHDRQFKKTLNLTAANKERIIKNYSDNVKFNFTIDSVEIPNPSKFKEPLKIIYPGGGFAGFSAAMRYEDNVFEVPMLQVFILNGLITMQDTIFNVGRVKRSEMEYRTFLQVKDIDLKQLIPAEKAVSIKDGKISADMMLSAPSIENFLANTSGYLSIYKIGRQFARQGVRVVMPDSSPFLTFLVDEWTIVHKFDFIIREGLINAKILFSRGGMGNIIGLEGNEIVQDRMPIEELFRKAGDEVKIYRKDALKTADNKTE